MPQTKEGEEIQKFIGEFSNLKTEAAIRQFEKAFKKKILISGEEVRGPWEKIWKSLTGSPYFVTSTDFEVPRAQTALAGRIYPKSSGYKTERIFTSISWEKIVEVRGRGLEREDVIHYALSGYHNFQGGNFRIIHHRLKPERVESRIGKDLAEKILATKKSQLTGTFDGIEQSVMVFGHWECLFNGRSNKWEKEDVEIQHEGICLQFQREVPVILPGPYIEANDHANHPVYRKVGDEPRKIVGTIHHFPYTVLRECTEREYRTQKEEGDRITKAARLAEERGAA